MITTNSFVKLILIGLFIWILGLEGIPALYSQSQNMDCDKLITEAEQKYLRGNFDESISSLVKCVSNPGLSEEQTQKAYRLLGLSYLAKDYEKDARDAISKLLDLVPNYQSDPVQDPPPYTKLVEELRKSKAALPKPIPVFEETAGKSSNKKWWIIGGVGLAAGAVAILLGSGGGNGGGKTGILSDPPNLPPGN